LWAWIGQVLDPDPSCNRAVARINAHRGLVGLPATSADTGGYCRARERVPEGVFRRLCRRRGVSLSKRARREDLWCGRVVKVVDGSSSSMSDTPANQRVYPQPSAQKAGCGFPAIAFVGIFCLATGALLDVALGMWSLHDRTLFSSLLRTFSPGDILLADRAYCAYAQMAFLRANNVDVVVRMHQKRRLDFRRGRVLGLCDHIVTWTQPVRPSRSFPLKDWRRLPETLRIRECRFRVETSGFRPQTITLATTLLDAQAYPVEALADLYARRWEVELNFRDVKTTLCMEVLRGKSPDIIRKELYVHLLAYNLIRAVIHDAASRRGLPPRSLSFKGALQHLVAHADLFTHYRAHRRASAFSRLLDLVAQQTLPHRPGRIEPRVRKRRPKNYPLMTQPRHQLQAQLRT